MEPGGEKQQSKPTYSAKSRSRGRDRTAQGEASPSNTVSYAPEGRRSLTWAWKGFNCTAEGDHTGTGNQLLADRVSFSLYI